MAEKIQVGVIFGGRSGEHEVSLMSARSVLSVMDPQRYTVMQIGITKSGSWIIGEEVLEALEGGQESTPTGAAAILPDPSRPGPYRIQSTSQGEVLEKLAQLDVIFPVLHGTFGEDGTLQGLLEMADVAYVGSGVLGSSVGMDKAMFKDVMRANAIPVVDSILVSRREIAADLAAVLDRSEKIAAYPLFVKPANLGSSVGVTKCRSRADLVEGILEAARFDRRILVEQGVLNPREIEVSVLGNDDPQASVPGEIIPGDDFYSYDAKYMDCGSQLVIPAALPAETLQRIQTVARQAYMACDCAGMARVDFLLDGQSGALYLSELNTIPGFTRISMYPKLWEASGLPYPALIDRLIELAFDRKAERDRTVHEYGSRQ
jgi:D-alanine-D-alanine ligase